jgi:hypothetical protein
VTSVAIERKEGEEKEEMGGAYERRWRWWCVCEFVNFGIRPRRTPNKEACNVGMAIMMGN